MRLLIARHGNTFAPGESVLRVGVRSDIPLVEKGEQQAKALGDYVKQQYPDVVAIYSGELQRSQRTAQLIANTAELDLPIQTLSQFNEIDYAVDEGKTEQEIIARIGQAALDAWDERAEVPSGWSVNPQHMITSWQTFAKALLEQYSTSSVLVVTSNGVARFALHLLGSHVDCLQSQSLKLATGAIGCLQYAKGNWQLIDWNVRP